MSVYLFAYQDWAFRIGREIIVWNEQKIAAVYVPHKHLEDATDYFLDVDYYDDTKTQHALVVGVDPKDLASVRGQFKPEDILLFYGWSWMVPPEFTEELLCICLHPSPLPKYRGGSPIQNQVIAGETKSAVTLFKMGKGIDDGPIFDQLPISLGGDLYDIFNEMVGAGVELTAKLLAATPLEFVVQQESEATYCKRRKPSESEILPTESAKEVYNKVRCLLGPYPNAFIRGADGKKIYLQKVTYEP